ncbi:MAG: hypothetical protein HOP02_14320 [Methylococcaceae bacterium]|nr:hypothetical protein [Methylococcaceae bacterium]
MAAFIDLANAQGKKGYWYLNDYSFGDSFSLYAKNNSSNTTFSYKALPLTDSSVDLLKQANDEGTNGYLYIGDYSFGADTAALYIKDNSKKAKFSYQALPLANSSADFIKQANDEGTDGYGYYVDLGFKTPSRSSAAIYVKDGSTKSTFEYKALTPANSSADFIKQANDEGTDGYGYYVDLGFKTPSQSSAAIYVKNSSAKAKFNY